jgi:pimeloyl-ACP methyl ester carboxylesterase
MRPSSHRLPLLLALQTLSCGGVAAHIEVATIASDGVELRGDYFEQEYEVALPTLVMVHEPGTDRSALDFDGLWGPLRSEGYNLLAVNLRGHGTSEPVADIDAIRLDPAGYPLDILAWIEFLREREDAGAPLAVDHLAIMGMGTSASVGAAALGHGLFRCAVLTSPLLEEVRAFGPAFAGDDDDSAAGDDDSAGDPVADLELTRVLWVWGEEDEPVATDSQALYERSTEPRGQLVTPGDLHGIEILWGDDVWATAMTDFCDPLL